MPPTIQLQAFGFISVEVTRRGGIRTPRRIRSRFIGFFFFCALFIVALALTFALAFVIAVVVEVIGKNQVQ